MKTIKNEKCLINGEWVKGKEDFESINPATGEVIGNAYKSTSEQIRKATYAAREAFNEWSKSSIQDRAEILKKVSLEIYTQGGELGEATSLKKLITSEMGKPLPEAEIEVFESGDMLSFYAEEGKAFLAGDNIPLNRSLFPNKVSFTNLEPIGIIAVIKPWNYPLELPLWSIGAALLTGNTVIFKPSELTPFVGLELGKIFQKAGLPKGVLNIVTGDGETGQLLINSDVDMVAFTGSVETGKKIAKICGEKLCKTSLELGGKDPFIVCEDANIEQAVNAAVWGAFTNCGQVCVSAERFYVDQKVAPEFIEKFVAKTKNLRIGNGLETNVDIGPLASQKQLDKVQAHISDAVKYGAKILYGGKRADEKSFKDGFFFLPTVITEVNHKMKIMTEETFGPVAPIMVFSDLEEAIILANDSIYGLGASIWTKDLKKTHYISENINAGIVWINEINVAYPQCPWGGIKQSGWGKELSKYAIHEYVNIKHINIDFGNEESRDWWFPYGK